MVARQQGVVVCSYDGEGDPVTCMNRKYIGGKFLANKRLCHGCEHEAADSFVGEATGKLFVGWYCTFELNH